ncbi:MAG: TetR/AcrR family transcriptional regulator [Myxococcota bacterium]
MANAAMHRESLVRTAMRLFRRQGYASTGLQQILVESGAPRGSLYHYFPDGKEELGAAAVELAGALVDEMLSDLAKRHASSEAFVRAYVRVMAGWMEESAFRSGCPIATTLLECAPESPAITEAGRAAFDCWIGTIAAVFERDGTPRREARREAEQLIASVEGALIVSRIRGAGRPILDVARRYRSARS